MMKTEECQTGVSKLKVLRNKLNLSQAEFAEYLGVNQNTIAQYESGAREFRLNLKQMKEFLKLMKIAEYKLDDLV